MDAQKKFLKSFRDDVDSVHISFNAPSRPIESTFSEARKAARFIYQQAQSLSLSVQLCLSGGIDSEAMAEAFLAEGLPFEVITLRFNNSWNDFDIAPAIEFCQHHQLQQTFLDMDIQSFLEGGEYLKYARLYRCNSYQLCAHLWMLEQLHGLPVLAGQQFVPIFEAADLSEMTGFSNKNQLPENLYPKKFIGLSGDRQLSYERYSQITGKPLVANFMQYTPELALSHHQLPTYQKLLEENRETGNINLSYQKKCEWYKEAGFQAEAKQDKFTGFEKLQRYYAEVGGHEWYINDLYRRDLEVEMPNRKNFWAVPLLQNNYASERNEPVATKLISRRHMIQSLSLAASVFGLLLLQPSIVWGCCCDSDCFKFGGTRCEGATMTYCTPTGGFCGGPGFCL